MNAYRAKLREIIFGTDTPAGKRFDVTLLWIILLSLLIVMLDSVPSIQERYSSFLYTAEWILTIIFTVEYITRIWISDKPRNYILSYYGIIDLIALLPTYLSLFFIGSQYLLVVRTLRLLRVFRVLKLVSYSRQAALLMVAMRKGSKKIVVFLGALLIIVTIMGTLMYMIEGPSRGFTSIPRSMYWAIVTLTTVGYGDIAPQTVLGQLIASIIMILGYSIIAVPTGIVSVEIARADTNPNEKVVCTNCHAGGHQPDAHFCKYCGVEL